MSEVNTLKPVAYALQYNKGRYDDDVYLNVEWAKGAQYDLNADSLAKGMAELWEIVQLHPMEWLPVELAPKEVDLLLCTGNGSAPFIAMLCHEGEWIDYDGNRHDPKYFMLLPEGKEDEA